MNKPIVLFIEDDAFLTRIYSKALEDAGYEVILASTGEEGIKQAERNNPNIILLDIILPHAHGFEIMEHLKTNDKTANIPILVLTNLSGQEDVIEASRLGASAYMIKAHALPEEVVRKIASLLK
jgi:DNA-binding response OmpR family regulator